jgi:hypothetical protein
MTKHPQRFRERFIAENLLKHGTDLQWSKWGWCRLASRNLQPQVGKSNNPLLPQRRDSLLPEQPFHRQRAGGNQQRAFILSPYSKQVFPHGLGLIIKMKTKPGHT